MNLEMLNIKNITIGFYCLAITFACISCGPTKKALPIQEALEKKDTVQTVIIKDEPKIDSGIFIKEMLQKVWNNRINYKTFNAKVKTEYYGQEQNQNFTVYVSMIKDSIIYMQLKGFMGIVGLQARITQDSVIVVQKIDDKHIKKRSISYLQEVSQIPFDFNTIQDLLIGNPVFTSNNLASYKQSNGQLLALVIGDVFKHLVTINEEDLNILHSKLDDKDQLRNRTCDITYSNYINTNGFNFSTYRSVSVAEKAKLDITLDFKEYSFNEPLKYVFSLPKNYKIK